MSCALSFCKKLRVGFASGKSATFMWQVDQRTLLLVPFAPWRLRCLLAWRSSVTISDSCREFPPVFICFATALESFTLSPLPALHGLGAQEKTFHACFATTFLRKRTRTEGASNREFCPSSNFLFRNRNKATDRLVLMRLALSCLLLTSGLGESSQRFCGRGIRNRYISVSLSFVLVITA